ncbi:MAG: glycosyltransferase family 2 protein [Oscillospiraceae bacterium]|nr:glycosyltransferase family 2 protein [Oscillospiraceae bacterium]
MPKLSVVIPVYNVEKYLSKCIDSVINQTLNDIEIILVNDGSKDSSGEICERYAELDSRVKYICKENGGVVSARKAGTNQATSEYITFIDSDDWVSESFFEELYNNISGYDLLISNHYMVKPEVVTYKNELAVGVYDTSEKMKYLIDNMVYATAPEFTKDMAFFTSICSKLYKTDMVKDTFKESDPNIFYHEDNEFLYKYILKCKSVICTDICGYYYLDRDDSCLHSVHNDYLLNLNNFYNSLLKTFRQSEHSESLIKQLQMLLVYRGTTNIPRTMGFHPDCMIIRYINPYLNRLNGKKVALYGAGLVGKDYYFQMKKSKSGAPVLWVDKNYDRYSGHLPVYPVENLRNADFDYITIAVENEELANKIKNNLVGMGITENKILWEEPIRLY